jgi:hypothetical protein
MGRRHFRPRRFRGVNEDREAINRMTVICLLTTTLRDFAMIERAPVREPVRVCPKCDDRTRKTTSAPGQGRGASADQVEPSAMDREERKCSRDRPNQMREENRMTNINYDRAEGMRVRAREAEQKWRAERGFAKKGPLPKERQPQLRPQPLERKVVERREQRRQQRIEREAFRVPLLMDVAPVLE